MKPNQLIAVILLLSIVIGVGYGGARMEIAHYQKKLDALKKRTDEFLSRVTYFKDHETNKYYIMYRGDERVLVSEVSEDAAKDKIINQK